MTGKELVQSVAHLGFDSDVTSQDRLFSIMTLAIRMCAARFPKICRKIYSVSGDSITVPLASLDEYLELDRVPLTLDGKPYFGYKLLADKIVVNSGAVGELCVRYHPIISEIDTESVEAELPVREGAQHLTVLLVAYLYWQEDEPEKAAEYLRQYNAEATVLSRALTPQVSTRVHSVNNW